MSQSNRGAAQVSLMWVIALLVIALMTVSLAWMSQSKITELESTNASLITARAEKSAEADELRNQINEIGKAVGFREEGSVSGPSLTTVSSSIAEFSNIFPSVDPESKTLQVILPGAIGDYQASQAKVATLQREVDQLRGDNDAKQAEIANVIREKDSTLADARRDLEDTRNSLNAQIVDAERRYNGLREQYRTLDDRLTATVSSKDDEVSIANASAKEMKQRNDILAERLNGVKRRSQSPDGSILTANDNLRKAWIDLGRRQRIQPGMEFEVLDASSDRLKGRVRVTKVDESRSEVAVLDVVDRFDPIREDDVIRNAMFDPTRDSVAVLLGNGFAGKSASDMSSMLAELGIRVNEEVTNEADFLILGTPFFDEDTGEMVPWHHHNIYKAAQGMSLEVVHRRDWAAWLGL